jgi:hypothetical protein
MIQQINSLYYLKEAIIMEIVKQQIQITLSKAEVNTLLTEALADESASAAIKRALNPLLSNSFPQFPDFTQATLGDTAEDGSVTVTLRQPKPAATPAASKPAVNSPLKSMEPLVVEDDPEEAPDDSAPEPEESPEYVD